MQCTPIGTNPSKEEYRAEMKIQGVIAIALSVILLLGGIFGFAKLLPLNIPLSLLFFGTGLSLALATIWTCRRLHTQLS